MATSAHVVAAGSKRMAEPHAQPPIQTLPMRSMAMPYDPPQPRPLAAYVATLVPVTVSMRHKVGPPPAPCGAHSWPPASMAAPYGLMPLGPDGGTRWISEPSTPLSW